MADKLINTDTMIGKVIAVMVALLFVVILAFPVANSLSNQGSGGGESEPITYTNTGDFYYKSATADSSEHTLEIEYTRELNEKYFETIIETDGNISYSKKIYFEGSMESGLKINDSPCCIIGYTDDITYGSDLVYGDLLKFTTDQREYIDCAPTDIEGTPDGDYFKIRYEFSIKDGMFAYKEYDSEEINSIPISYYISTMGEYVCANAPAIVKSTQTPITVYASINCIDDSSYHNWDWCMIQSHFDSSDIVNDEQEINARMIGDILYSSEMSATLISNREGEIRTLISMPIECSFKYTQGGATYSGSMDNTQFIVPTTVTVTPNNTHTVTYTNSGDYYYKSATADSNEHIVDIEYTEITGDPYGSFTTVLKIDGTTLINQTIELGAEITYLFGWSQSQTFGLSIQDGYMWIMNNADNTSEQIFGTFIEEVTLEHGYTAYAQYVISDGVLSFTDDENVEHSYSIDYYMSETGEYVLADRPVVSASDNTLIRLWIDCIVEDINFPRPLTFSVYGTIGSGTIVSDTESISLNVSNCWGDVISYSIESTLTSSRVGDLITLDNVSCEGNITTVNTTYDGCSASSTKFIVPTTVTVEEEGGGSDSEGISGIAKELIKVVPILLIVGILLVLIIPMIQSRMQ